ncbi:hypothetical protein EFK50_08115 [Nocardioides marmoriginsengisoli]|uniref:Uncharacterized protein n=1 Tax=Nocardioides marmoriginsengisoli TaxID=661483 RepID=A0A3N0CJS8_9ACTN|nr:hypothetical protein EFK50_08115 [Nocardioides marmoriginsengisoli]
MVRAHRNLATLISRVQPGDLVVIDQRDLGGDVAQALLDRKPLAVINAAEFISGRFANRGPQTLVGAGVRLFEGNRDQVLGLRDGSTLRLHEGTLYDDAVVVLDVRELDAVAVRDQMQEAGSGLAVQLESFAHAASELVRREEPLVLHGLGMPPLATSMTDRVVVVIGTAATRADLAGIRRLRRRTKPVVIAVDSGIDLALRRRLKPAVGVLSGGAAVSDKALARCAEVVLVEPGHAVRSQVEKLNLPAVVLPTSLAAADVGLLLAHHGNARLAVPVGSPATLDEFVDRDRNDQASNVLTRLRLGTRLVEGRAVPLLRGRPRRTRIVRALVAAVLVGAVGVLAFTPTGERWRDDLRAELPDSLGGSHDLQRVEDQVADRDRQLEALTTRAQQRDAFTTATAANVVRGTLAGRSVAVVALPGADPETLTALRGLVGTAGAQVTADVTVAPAAVSGAQRGLVEALTSQMLTQAKDVTVPAGATGYQRLGALLARAAGVGAAAKVPRAAYDTTAVGVVSGLQTAELATAKVTARAALTLIVAGRDTTPDEDSALATTVAAYGGQTATVVTGPTAETAVLKAVRPGAAVSSAGGSEGVEGRVVAILALAAQTRGDVGDYGPGGGDGAVPPLS